MSSKGHLRPKDAGSAGNSSPKREAEVRHQLNNDLGVILAQCEMLLAELRNRPTEAARVRSIIDVVHTIVRRFSDSADERQVC